MSQLLALTPASVPGSAVETDCSAERSGAVPAFFPEALVALALRGRQHAQADVVHQGPLGDQVGDVADLVAGELAHHEGGSEQGVLAGEQFAGPGDVDQRPCLLVQFHAVDAVEGGEEGVGGVDQAVVLVEGLDPGEGAVLDAAAQRVDAVEGVQDGGEALVVVLVDAVADIGIACAPAELGDGVVRGAPRAAQRGQGVRGTWIGQVDQGLAAFLLEHAHGVLNGIPELLRDGRDLEELGDLTSRQYRGEAPHRDQGHQRHEKQRHDLPADRLPAKAHGLPQLDPRRPGVHMYVNKRREPTTDAHVTRSCVRNPNLRTADATWGVLLPLREIASCHQVGRVGPEPTYQGRGLAGFFRFFDVAGES
ncbi:hypothetical protein RKD46_007141 [Streptomyces pseudovenezuelae]